MQPTPVEGLSIDLCVHVPCPAARFAYRPAAKACPPCEHYNGVVELNDDIRQPWDERFRISCRCPIARRVTMVLDQ